MRVLVVDDLDTERRTWGRIITSLGHTAIYTTNANKAIDAMFSENHIDAIVTDTQMPNGDGIAVLQAVMRIYDEGTCPPTLIHSSATEYWYDGEQIDLETFVKENFGIFARFAKKDAEVLSRFLEELARTPGK